MTQFAQPEFAQRSRKLPEQQAPPGVESSNTPTAAGFACSRTNNNVTNFMSFKL